MSKVASGKKQHRSMRGKSVDMDMLRKRNELTPAVGNARVNARGDELGAGGKIVRKREDIVREHYKNAGSVQSDDSVTARAPRETTSTKAVEEPVATEQTKETKKTASRTKKQEPAKIEEELTPAEKELLEEDDWEEDENGNFVKKDS